MFAQHCASRSAAATWLVSADPQSSKSSFPCIAVAAWCSTYAGCGRREDKSNKNIRLPFHVNPPRHAIIPYSFFLLLLLLTFFYTSAGRRISVSVFLKFEFYGFPQKILCLSQAVGTTKKAAFSHAAWGQEGVELFNARYTIGTTKIWREKKTFVENQKVVSPAPSHHFTTNILLSVHYCYLV